MLRILVVIGLYTTLSLIRNTKESSQLANVGDKKLFLIISYAIRICNYASLFTDIFLLGPTLFQPHTIVI